MKKLLSFVLAVILVISSFSMVANATVQDVYRDGEVFVVTHKNPLYPTSGVTEQERNKNHVAATGLLCEQIEAITYAEVLMFNIDTLYVGLPYDAVDKIRALDTVISVEPYSKAICSSKTPQEKIDPQLKELIDTSSPDDVLKGVTADFAYSSLVYYGFCKEDFQTSQEYIEAKRAVDKEYHTKMNTQIFEDIQKDVDAQLLYHSIFGNFVVLEIKVSEIEKLSQMPQVSGIYAPQREEPTDEPTSSPDSQFKYLEKFKQWIRFPQYDESKDSIEGTFGKFYDYDELYEYKDESENVQWALITVKVDLFDPWDVVDTVKIGNRIIKWWRPGAALCGFTYVIYDAKQDTFIDLSLFKEGILKGYDVDSYEGLADVFDKLNIGGVIGDVDMDNEVSIMDATEIQMYLSDLKEYVPYINAYEYIGALADVDNDKQMTVMDATALQKKLVNSK